MFVFADEQQFLYCLEAATQPGSEDISLRGLRDNSDARSVFMRLIRGNARKGVGPYFRRA